MTKWYQKQENFFFKGVSLAKVNIVTDYRNVIILKYLCSLESTENLKKNPNLKFF